MRFVSRVARAPILLLSVAIGGILMFLYLAAISVGGWYEKLLLRLWPTTPGWLPASLGVCTFAIGGIIVPAILLGQLIGWPGIFVGPTIMVLLVSWLDRW